MKNYKDVPVTPMSYPAPGSMGKTGSWRVFRPVIDREKCTKCGMCTLFCPEDVINTNFEIDYEYCKGCGICAKECGAKAISLEREVI
jgi:pyruvate ferredoxin oxidoreductase delta subunit